jgi:DNA uptake protein ComE-like DNA-binding protein
MRKRGEMTRSYARGIVALIFFVLAVQVAIFTIKSYENNLLYESREQVAVKDSVREKETKPERPPYWEKKNVAKQSVVKSRRDIMISDANADADADADVEIGSEIEKRREEYVPINLRSISSTGKIELNSADSVDLVSLPGIGPFYASKILNYRKRLGGFAFKEQLMEVYGIDKERFSIFEERVWADTSLISKIKVSEAPQELLSTNPYIGAYVARAIIKFRELEEGRVATLAELVANRIIKEEFVKILKYYLE